MPRVVSACQARTPPRWQIASGQEDLTGKGCEDARPSLGKVRRESLVFVILLRSALGQHGLQPLHRALAFKLFLSTETPSAPLSPCPCHIRGFLRSQVRPSDSDWLGGWGPQCTLPSPSSPSRVSLRVPATPGNVAGEPLTAQQQVPDACQGFPEISARLGL